MGFIIDSTSCLWYYNHIETTFYRIAERPITMNKRYTSRQPAAPQDTRREGKSGTVYEFDLTTMRQQERLLENGASRRVSNCERDLIVLRARIADVEAK